MEQPTTREWLARMEAVENDVRALKSALLGTLDGRAGLKHELDQFKIELRQNTTTTQRIYEVVDSFKADRFKLVGFMIGATVGSSSLTAVVIKLLGGH